MLAYQFNKPKEEPAPVVEEDPDRDGDGILDKDDLCPDTPGLRKNTKDALIQMVMESLMRLMIAQKPLDLKKTTDVPYPDTDGDGLTGQCRRLPKYCRSCGKQRMPIQGYRRRWLLDKDDECPMTPGPKENNGCPIIEKEEQEVLNTAFSNLEFETSLDVIKSGSKPALIELANTLKKKPDWKLKLSGHTDNVGDDDANMVLSKKRAESVKKFLTTQGIDENRIKTEFFGESQPIEDNNTAAGRQKNRRVEFKIIFD